MLIILQFGEYTAFIKIDLIHLIMKIYMPTCILEENCKSPKKIYRENKH